MDKRMINQSKAEVYKKEMIGKRFRHFKGNVYVVTNVAVHSETEELVVIYESEENKNLVWVRPLEMFLSEVDKEKYPNINQKLSNALLFFILNHTTTKKVSKSWPFIFLSFSNIFSILFILENMQRTASCAEGNKRLRSLQSQRK